MSLKEVIPNTVKAVGELKPFAIALAMMVTGAYLMVEVLRATREPDVELIALLSKQVEYNGQMAQALDGIRATNEDLLVVQLDIANTIDTLVVEMKKQGYVNSKVSPLMPRLFQRKKLLQEKP